MGNGMEWPSTSTVIERAKEELEILETQYPNGFHHLKSELKIFISSFDSHNLPPALLPTSSSVLTQESSTSKKRKANRPTSNCEAAMPKIQKVGCNGYTKKIDAVLERAQQCIRKIRRFKATL